MTGDSGRVHPVSIKPKPRTHHMKLTSTLIRRLLLDITQREGEPALALDKQVAETAIVCDPGRDDTKSTASLVERRLSRPCADRKEKERDTEGDEQRHQANVATKGTDAGKHFRITFSNKLEEETNRNMKVKINHVIKYMPSAWSSSCADVYAESTPLPGIRIVAYDIQKAP